MLSKEQAKERLKQFKSTAWTKQAKARIGKLPAKDADAARTLTFEKPRDRDWEKRRQRVAEAAAQFDRMSVKARTAAFTAIFPKLGPDMERCWQRMRSEPYTTGVYGTVATPFRVPEDHAASRFHRGNWLESLTKQLQFIDQDALWLAQWAPYISEYYISDCIGSLLASAIDADDQQGYRVMQVLIDSANGEHEIGMMGRHIPRALLGCGRAQAWQFMEKFLLAAQRQEGLRQAILETVDRAHPEAFKRMLRLILDENLVRFASVVRAADLWFALRWDSASSKVIKQSIKRALLYLETPADRDAALTSTDPEAAYFALWTQGVTDASQAVASASALLKHDQVEMRFTGGWMLKLLQLPAGEAELATVLDDPSLEVVNLAVDHARSQAMREQSKVDVFAKLELLLERVPKKPKQLKPLLFPWLDFKLQQSEVADAMGMYVDESRFELMVKHVPLMSVYGREAFVRDLRNRVEKNETLPDAATPLLLRLAGDASPGVREESIKLLGTQRLDPNHAPDLEAKLTRKAGDLRRGIIGLLQKQSQESALDSADRLTSSGNAMQRLAGVELIAGLAASSADDAAGLEACRQRAAAYAMARPKLGEVEQGLLNPLLGVVEDKPTLDNALGLMDPSKLTPSRAPKARKVKLMTKQAVGLIQSLDALIHAHRETPVKVWAYDGEQEKLLGTATWGLVTPQAPEHIRKGDGFPLGPLWEAWYAQLPKSCRDKDGLTLSRARILQSTMGYRGKAEKASIVKDLTKVDISKLELKYAPVTFEVLTWLIERHSGSASIDFMLDAAETGLAGAMQKKFASRWIRAHDSFHLAWLNQAQAEYDEKIWTDAQTRRLIEMLVWLDKPVDAKGRPLITQTQIDKENQTAKYWQRARLRSRPAPLWFARGVGAGLFNEHDIYDNLLGPRDNDSGRGSFDMIRTLSTRKPSEPLKAAPELQQYFENARQRVLDVELTRGDVPTVASWAASTLSYIPGTPWLVKMLKGMGKLGFARNSSYGDASLEKKAVFSSMVRASAPAPGETADSFKAQMAQAQISQKQLTELGMYAPQWAGFIEHALGWDGYEDAVWWVHAHTKDDQWSVEKEVRDQWAAQVAERTPLDDKDLVDGAVDVAWFHDKYSRLKKTRWQKIDAAAKLASSSGGHKRAQLFADAMLGNVTKTELTKRIKDKRHKDAIRAIGLLPLQRGKSREKDLLSRYELMQEFVRSSKQFGQMRQTSERRAVEIEQQNLARTAGYPDPLRLQWAMEAKAIADLKSGSVSVTAGPTTVTLSITDTGEPAISVIKNDKPLKSIPAAAKKDKKVKALSQRKTLLKRQAGRMRKSLEQMMCKHEALEPGELAALCEHPLMRPMLERLIFIGEGIVGFPDKGGRVLVDHAGKQEPIKKAESLRLAHPFDLLESKDWSAWQHALFTAERVQPFKQAFRELYVLTDAEKKTGTCSKRYAGQQVNPSQALALLGSRGWVTLPEEGVRKMFHDTKLSAWLEFQEGFYTPAEIDGLTLENVRFAKTGQWEPMKLEDVPPMLFSEVMRDMDLVVSVAHRGGVDPEASASTVEMRSDLMRETLAVLNIENVRIENNHALINGKFGKYSVHLGSAVTHLMPGGSLFIVPVHSQHRGRLFLPFVDDDPKTAEVLSKTLLLARDERIKDPNLLDQIRSLSK